jgi:peroxiredoxin
LNRAHSDIEASGARLVLIGQATPRHAAHYQRRFAPELQILADEKRESYKAMGIPRGTASQLIGPKSVIKGIGRVATSGHLTVQGRPVGDVTQLGATFIVLASGEIAWSHVSEDASDNPSIDELLEALREVV